MTGKYVGLGVAFGASLGAAFDTIPIGVASGLLLGVTASAPRKIAKTAQRDTPET